MEEDSEACTQFVSINGGLLAQDQIGYEAGDGGSVRDEARPSAGSATDLDFGWRIVKHVKSNAIVVVKNGMTYGVGAR